MTRTTIKEEDFAKAKQLKAALKQIRTLQDRKQREKLYGFSISLSAHGHGPEFSIDSLDQEPLIRDVARDIIDRGLGELLGQIGEYIQEQIDNSPLKIED